MGWIKGVQDELTNIYILVTSRPEQDIIASFNGWVHTDKIIQLQSRLVSDDITAYTKARVSEMPRWKKRPDIQAEIESTLLEKADGMYVVVWRISAFTVPILPSPIQQLNTFQVPLGLVPI
jgi:hypothetical protein